MFGPILAAITNFGGWLRSFVDDLWRQAVHLATTTWGALVIAAGWVWGVVTWLTNKVGEIIDTVQGLIMPDVPAGQSWSEALEFVNSFLPVSELFAFLIAYSGLIVTLTTYRVIKSWVPSVA